MSFVPNPKPLNEQTPREIDEQLAHWDGVMRSARYAQSSARDHLAYLLANLRGPWQERDVESAQDRIVKAHARVAEIAATIAVFDAEFVRRGGWKRYFIVMKGHIHRERQCPSCTYKTSFGWLPDLSDCDETEMVKVHGDLACAICFPQVLSHPAYIASAALRKAQEEAEAAQLCPASGKPSGSWGNGYKKCPDCGTGQRTTKNGKFRKHSKPQPKETTRS